MAWFNNLGIAVKISLSFALMLVITLVVGVMGINGSNSLNKMLTSMYEVNMVPTAQIANANIAAIYHNRLMYQYIIEPEKTEMDKLLVEMDARKQDMRKLIDQYQQAYMSEKEVALIKQFEAAWAEYEASAKRMMTYASVNNSKAAMEVMQGDTKPKFQVLDDTLSELVNVNIGLGKKTFEESDVLSAEIRDSAIAALVAALILSVVITLLVSRSISNPISSLVDLAKRMAKGDFNFKVSNSHVQNEVGEMSRAIESVQQSVASMSSDTKTLIAAIAEGKLATRAEASKHQGDYAKIIAGFNDTLDAVVNPLNVAAQYVDDISKGHIPAKITDTYHGDFNTIKNNLNACIEAVNKMVADAASLSKAAVAGELSTRADATQHQGDFRKIVQGVNDTLDAVINPLNVAAQYVDDISKGNIPAKITETYHGDFNTIKNNLNQCVDAVNALVSDAAMLADAAKQGLLSTRADENRHQGDFRKVVKGVNNTLDAVIGPLNVAAACVDRISKGDIPAKITETYQGDFNNIKDNLNTCIEAINRLVTDANRLADAASEGRITTRADATLHQGDFRKVVEGVNATLETIVEPIITVKEAVETINSAASEISSGNTDLSQRTEEQASSLEQAAASMEELASTVKQNAENAKQANQLALAASGVAVKGGEVVSEVVNTMSTINESARKIEDIISVIDGIAFQTNILALNAAVEAARAGEQGRGFAVVAGEVRNLAQRSATAAKEIKELITDSVNKTQQGTMQVENAGTTMEEVVTSVKRVADIIAEIAAASAEQSTGIDQVNTAVTSMDEVTQQNAALVEQAAAAAMSLVDQANKLSDVVSVFKVDGKAGHQQRAHNSPMRHTSKPVVTVAKPLAKPVVIKPAKIVVNATHNDVDWEEF